MAIAPGTPLWRYTHLNELENVLRDRKLRLTRVDQFPDPFEGSVPTQQIEDQGVIIRGGVLMRMAMGSIAAHYPGHMEAPPHDPRDPHELITIRRRAAARSVHASCWTMAPETEPRWRLYCSDDDAPGQGVAMRTTFERLEGSVARHHLIVRDIQYRRYQVGAAFPDDLAPFLHKREGFKDEEEVRLLNYNEQQPLIQLSRFNERSSDPLF
jgi:hypothetical protein